MPDSILHILKSNFDGEFNRALDAYRDLASPTTLALIEWALEQPKTVYALEFRCWDDTYVEGIFATADGAELARLAQGKDQKYFDTLEYEVKP